MKTAVHFRLAVAAVALAAFVASCSRDALVPEAPREPVAYTFGLAGNSTRALLREDGKGFYGHWEAGDRLGTSVSGSAPAYSNIYPGTPSTFRIYRQGGISAGEKAYAYYPYNSSTKSIQSVRFTIPAAQKQDDSGFDFDAMPMAAEPYEVSTSGTDTFTYLGEIFMMNLASLVEFEVFSSEASYLGEEVRSVTLSADAPVCGSFTKDITVIDSSDDSSLALSGLSGRSVQTVLSASQRNPGGSRGESLKIYMAVAPGSFGGTVTVVTDKAVYTYTLPSGTTFRRSFVKSFGIDLGRCKQRESEGESGRRTWLDCLEMPAVEVSGDVVSGYFEDYDDQYFYWDTPNPMQRLVTHTFFNESLRSRNYTVFYDGDRHCPLWTAFAMHSSTWADNGVDRSNKWIADPAIDASWQQPGLDNASAVGFSRGHFVASNYRKTTDYQNAQTFYYSNQAPQWQNSFNSGVWSSLESKVKDAAPSGRDTLYVVTGVLFEGTQRTLPSGSLSVSVPSHFYKCLMMCGFDASGEVVSARGIAYIYTNEAHSGDSYDNPTFVTTIDAIEQRAGLDFFHNVPVDMQNAAERSSTALW